MGGWPLEVGKMALYMTFPVALFYIFNQPQYFEEWVTKTKREIFPPENQGHRKQMEDAIKMIRERKNREFQEAFEKMEKEKKV